jgi:hypothetical protein
MLSHRGNVRTSKFWRKLKEKKRNFFQKFTKGHIRILFRSRKKSNLSYACVPLRRAKSTLINVGVGPKRNTFL